ncbi:MAG: acyl-CoA dehydratase activase [Bacteroidota bacterium]
MFFLGVDIGSLYTKLVVINSEYKVVYSDIFRTMARNNKRDVKINDTINKYKISKTCSTGYGRKLLKTADIIKTELFCASMGVTQLVPIEKTIVDIGGEDIKLLKSADNGKVIDFYMNSKCAAGTGAFITEVAERAELNISEMSKLAAKSTSNKELNSFCTVFAKTEIMKWIFDDTSDEDLAKGIYISIANRIQKIPADNSLPVYLIGGVAEYHPFLKNIIEDKFNIQVTIPEKPQLINAFGAACFARKSIN